MSATQQQPTPGTGNGRTATRRPLKAGGKRQRRTKAQLAAAKLPGEAVTLPAAISGPAQRLATMIEWFGDATPAQRQRDLACLNAMYPALPKAA
jgi:hypothetical protein